MTAQIIARCTPDEKAAWLELAKREDVRRSQGGRYWNPGGLSVLVRELLDERLKANPAPAAAGRNKRSRVVT
jgi:hypothetical protein